MTLIQGVFDYAPLGQATFCGVNTCDEPTDVNAYEGLCAIHQRQYDEQMAEGERQAELAAERYYEGGWDTLGVYDYEGF